WLAPTPHRGRYGPRRGQAQLCPGVSASPLPQAAYGALLARQNVATCEAGSGQAAVRARAAIGGLLSENAPKTGHSGEGEAPALPGTSLTARAAQGILVRALQAASLTLRPSVAHQDAPAIA